MNDSVPSLSEQGFCVRCGRWKPMEKGKLIHHTAPIGDRDCFGSDETPRKRRGRT